MNFMETNPRQGLSLNQELQCASLDTAIKFIDGLVDLGVIRRNDNVVNNPPLFLIPKSAQPG